MPVLRPTRAAPWLATLIVALMVALGAQAQHHGRRRHRPRHHRAHPAHVEKKAPEPPAQPPPSEQAAGQADAGTSAEAQPAATPSPAPEAATPAPAEQPSSGSAAAPEPSASKSSESDPFAEAFGGPDLTPLRDELTTIMDDLVQTRSRMAVLGRQLFKTRIRVSVQNRAKKRQALAHLTVELDGAPVYQTDQALGDDAQQVFEGFAAPGPHLITVVAQQRARANDDYRYDLRDTYRFEVVRGKLTELLVILDDDSGIAKDFPDDQEGQYDVRTRLRVATRELDAK